MNTKPLKLFPIVIPARDEEGCMASANHHLNAERKLRGVPNEILVVDDGFTDRTHEILQKEIKRFPQLKLIKNPWSHGFGRAITKGPDATSGDAGVIRMADESDDCRDLVRYGEECSPGLGCVLGS